MTIGINKEIKYIHFLKFKYLQNQQKYKQFIVKKFKLIKSQFLVQEWQ